MSRRVLVITVGGKSTRFELEGSRTAIVGRTPDCDLVIDDRLVSRRHAAFHNGATLEIEDLGSHNGTQVLAQGGETHGETVSMKVHHRLAPNVRVPVGPDAIIQIGGALVTVESAPVVRAPASPGIVVGDAAMTRLYELADRVAASELPVLLLGESGVGKEVLARFIHEHSARRGRDLLGINCGAIAENLLDAELFGYEKGAFTGAAKTTKGLLEAADGGTVFLDEVGELPAAFQVKLLRVLELGQVMRVGAREPVTIDVRYVAATNRDLAAEIASGRFREDLYYRLNGISLTIPPLRERRSEIVPLADLFLREDSARKGGAPYTLSAAAATRLAEYSWPGNVRQLKNVVRRASVLSPGQTIGAEHVELPEPGAEGRASTRHLRANEATLPPPIPATTPDALREQAEALEKQQIIEALEASAGNQTRTAELLGITRRALVARLNKYNLPRPRKGRDR